MMHASRQRLLAYKLRRTCAEFDHDVLIICNVIGCVVGLAQDACQAFFFVHDLVAVVAPSALPPCSAARRQNTRQQDVLSKVFMVNSLVLVKPRTGHEVQPQDNGVLLAWVQVTALPSSTAT